MNWDVSSSAIKARNDQYQKNAADVNRESKEKRHEKKLQFLDHGSTITIRHLDASLLHLYKRGTQILSNFLLLNLSLMLQISNLSYTAWLVMTEIVVEPMTMMEIKLSLRSVQLVQVT